MSAHIVLEVFESLGPERGMQVSLSDTEKGYGVRLAGPSFIGNSKLLRRVQIDRRTAELMKPYIDAALTHEPSPDGEHPALTDEDKAYQALIESETYEEFVAAVPLKETTK
jgi:hypothetical protein